MGNTKVQEEDNGRGKRTKKTTPLTFRQGRKNGGGVVVDYATATPAWLAAAIRAVAGQGGAIQFGYSRDGGVYTIVILLNGEIEKNYVKASEGIDEFLEGVYNDFSGDLPTDVVE